VGKKIYFTATFNKIDVTQSITSGFDAVFLFRVYLKEVIHLK